MSDTMKDWTPCQQICYECLSRNTEYRESSGDHDDEQYYCLTCDHYWWIEGSDY